MNRIKFTTGTISKITSEYYDLVLLNGEKIVYKSTLDSLTAAEYLNKYNNIILIN